MTDIRHLVCPHCHKVNRVPADKLSSGGNCGACKQPLWPDQVLELTEQTFATHTGRSDLPVLVDFWASWCGPCKMVSPIVEALAEEYQEKGLRVGKLDVDTAPAIATKYGIRSIPALIFFKNGQPVDQIVGAVPKGVLKSKIDAVLAS